MLPKWFDNWVRANPKDIYGPGILVGVVGAALILAWVVVTYGGPLATTSTQTGPAGTGMAVVKFATTAATPDPTIAGYVSPPPVEPAPGEPLARDAIPNAEPLLADLPVSQYERLVGAMRAWTGIPDLLAGEENYQTVVARRMIQMTQALNEAWAGHTNASPENGNVGVNCYSCHRGQPVPSGIWFNMGAVTSATAGWAAVQNRVTMTSQYTSLPSDALEKYLLEGRQIVVHDLAARVPTTPDLPTWQDTERTYALMNYFANSLGVNCTFCHNTRAFFAAQGEVTPQWTNASIGIQMVLEINNDYLVPLQPVFPANRLGPLGDAPKVACNTCHKGYQRPLGGMDMISDWPELATTAAPVSQ